MVYMNLWIRSKLTSHTLGKQTQQIIQPAAMIPIPEQETVKEKVPEYVKIGDIVCVEFIEQIFEGLKEYAKIDSGQDNLRLARILEKPDIVYTGVLFSDGIVDK